MNSKIIRIIGLAATVIGLGANLINDWADEQKMNEQIDKKVNEALAKRDANAKEILKQGLFCFMEVKYVINRYSY